MLARNTIEKRIVARHKCHLMLAVKNFIYLKLKMLNILCEIFMCELNYLLAFT